MYLSKSVEIETQAFKLKLSLLVSKQLIYTLRIPRECVTDTIESYHSWESDYFNLSIKAWQ